MWRCKLHRPLGLEDRITDAAPMVWLARAAMGNIWQNVTTASGLKAAVLVTRIFGLTDLWKAILADTWATVRVPANMVRLRGLPAENEG